VKSGAASWQGWQARGIAAETASAREKRLGHRPGRPSLILYLDTSSLVKLYVEKSSSLETERLVTEASLAAPVPFEAGRGVTSFC